MIVDEATYEDAITSAGPGDIVPLVDVLTTKEFKIDITHYD